MNKKEVFEVLKLWVAKPNGRIEVYYSTDSFEFVVDDMVTIRVYDTYQEGVWGIHYVRLEDGQLKDMLFEYTNDSLELEDLLEMMIWPHKPSPTDSAHS